LISRVIVSSVIQIAMVELPLTVSPANQDQIKDQPAPRSALLYPRRSREEFGGYSWV
jgi:hypothetical protein